MRDIAERRNWIDAWQKLAQRAADLRDLYELAESESDAGVLKDLETDCIELEKNVADLEFRKMLGGPGDDKSAILTIHPGAGGTNPRTGPRC